MFSQFKHASIVPVKILAVSAMFGWALPASAEYQFGFADVSLNRLDWTAATEAKSDKLDFNYLELEGGTQFTWGETYGFFDIENFDKGDRDLVRSAGKGVIRYFLPIEGLSLYAHLYDFNSKNFGEQNRVIGLGYQVLFPQGWFKPFLGINDVTQTYFNGLNGLMGGWAVTYSFKLWKADFQVTDWHELEFARAAAYAAGNGGKRVSQNGAAGLWWYARPTPISLGLQWRYAENKLGTPGWLSAAIATVRYVF